MTQLPDPSLTEYITFIILDIAVLLIMIMFLNKRDMLRQEAIDKKYENLTHKFIDSTINYHQSLIEVIKSIPEQQSNLIEKISELQLRSINSIIDELKIIKTKVEAGNITRDTLVKCITSRDLAQAELDRLTKDNDLRE